MYYSKKEKRPRPPKKAPPKINNLKVNKPKMAQSLNTYPTYRTKRDVEPIKPVVNAKVADEKLIHKAGGPKQKDFYPVIEKGKIDSNKPVKKKTAK